MKIETFLRRAVRGAVTFGERIKEETIEEGYSEDFMLSYLKNYGT